jgi:flagellar biosynthesis/type III secretory pathway M-ring protein FliF/YscJ
VDGWEQVLGLNWERMGVVTLLMLIVIAFATGKVLSRRMADREQANLKDGYGEKDKAHAEIVAYKDERIGHLEEARTKLADLLERRERQLGTVLDELAPIILQWGDAAREAARVAAGQGGGDSEEGT